MTEQKARSYTTRHVEVDIKCSVCVTTCNTSYQRGWAGDGRHVVCGPRRTSRVIHSAGVYCSDAPYRKMHVDNTVIPVKFSKADKTLGGNHLISTGNGKPYGITHCYLPPSSGAFPAFTSPETGTRFSTPEGCKAELTCKWLYPKIAYLPNTVVYLRNNRVISWLGIEPATESR